MSEPQTAKFCRAGNRVMLRHTWKFWRCTECGISMRELRERLRAAGIWVEEVRKR